MTRAAPRDLFDVAGFSRVALIHPLDTYKRSRIERVTKSQLERELVPMVRGDAPSLRELRNETWKIVKPLFALDEAEREFTGLLNQGELKPEILFPRDRKIAAALAKHPALLWKVANARSHRVR